MKKYKNYLIRGHKTDEAIAIIRIPSHFDLSQIIDGSNNGGVSRSVSVGNHSRDPTYTYKFSGIGISTVDMVKTMKLDLHPDDEDHNLLQSLKLEEITDAFFETVIELGLPWFQLKSYEYSTLNHEFTAISVSSPKPGLKDRSPVLRFFCELINTFKFP